MRHIANTATIRAGAQRFASAGMELRQSAMKIEIAANVLTTGVDGWRGRGADGYHSASQHIHADLKTSSEAFQRAASVLSALASQLDQVNQYRKQAERLEDRIHSLQGELWNADEYRRESIRDQISSLRYQLNDYDRQADFIENQANRNAAAAFDDIASLANRLYFGQGSSAQDQVGEFFAGLWGKAKDTVDRVGDELTEAFDDTTHFFQEKYKESQEGGLLGIFVGFFEGMGKSLLDTIEGLWSLTPSAAVYKAVTDWEGTKAKAAKIFYEYTHPIETAQARLAFIKGIPAMAKVVASTAVDSIERDLINGNAYTRSKWAGYAAGIAVETIGTLGVGEVGTATKAVGKVDDVIQAAGSVGRLSDDVAVSAGDTTSFIERAVETESSFASQFTYNFVENPGPLLEVHRDAIGTFRSGFYNVELLQEDTILYRSGKAGGGKNALGQYFTREPGTRAEGRIDSAVRPQWINPATGVLEGQSPLEVVYAIKLPKGTTIYEGPVGNQGGIYVGGGNQIFVKAPWTLKGVEVIWEKPIK